MECVFLKKLQVANLKFFKKCTLSSLIFNKIPGVYSNSYFDKQIWSSASVMFLTTYRSYLQIMCRLNPCLLLNVSGQYMHFNLKWSSRSSSLGISTLISSPMCITFFLNPKAANVFCFRLDILNSNICSKLACHTILTTN